MASALKHQFGPEVVRSIADDLRRAWPRFDRAAFVRASLNGLEELELTPRGAHVAAAMRAHLPDDYARAIRIVVDSFGPPLEESGLTGMAVFRYLPHAEFVRRFGLEHFEESMAAQHALTQRFTAEFSVRAFLEAHPERTLARLREWTRDPSAHVRRLVSEGTRPRLPWAPRLRAFVDDPTPVIELLERLKDDPERYVQRSVANNLNDIAKDHPERVVELARAWKRGASAGRSWIVGHALRSLVKSGNRGALELLGAGAAPRVQVGAVVLEPKRVKIGGALRFACELASTSRDAQELLVDFAVHFVKSDGSRRPKVFKLKRLTLAPRAKVELAGRVSLAVHTTRKPYPGRHALELLVNGRAFPLGEFDVASSR